MTLIATISSSAEAYGHPTECTNPVSGSVTSDSSSSVSVSGDDIATVDTATIHFDSHSHDYDETDGCHDNQSHDIEPSTVANSITVDGSPVYIAESDIASDPVSGENVDITDGGANSSVSIS